MANSFSRLGYVRVRADESEEAVARAGEAVSMLTARLRE
jgi:hypothetical protein